MSSFMPFYSTIEDLRHGCGVPGCGHFPVSQPKHIEAGRSAGRKRAASAVKFHDRPPGFLRLRLHHESSSGVCSALNIHIGRPDQTSTPERDNSHGLTALALTASREPIRFRRETSAASPGQPGHSVQRRSSCLSPARTERWMLSSRHICASGRSHAPDAPWKRR